MRDRLVELIKKTRCDNDCDGFTNAEICKGCTAYEGHTESADYLLENGVIVPPCKVGDTVWHIDIVGFGKNMLPIREVVPFVVPDLEWILMMYFNFSRFYYPTKKEAEQALKGGEG